MENQIGKIHHIKTKCETKFQRLLTLITAAGEMIPVNLELVNELWLPNIFIYNLKTFKVSLHHHRHMSHYFIILFNFLTSTLKSLSVIFLKWGILA